MWDVLEKEFTDDEKSRFLKVILAEITSGIDANPWRNFPTIIINLVFRTSVTLVQRRAGARETLFR